MKQLTNEKINIYSANHLTWTKHNESGNFYGRIVGYNKVEVLF